MKAPGVAQRQQSSIARRGRWGKPEEYEQEGGDMHYVDSPQSSQRTQRFPQRRSFGIFSDDYINQK